MRRAPDSATGGLLASLRAAPATVPALFAIALFVVWATTQGGYPVTHWAPGGLIVLALLGLALGVVGLDLRAVPLPVKIAVGCLAGYTALSFASILWAAVPGDAWEGANRTLLYLLVFALFALWPQRGASAALLLGAWTVAMICLAAFVALHVNAEAARPARVFIEERLVYPTGYVNASAAQWLMAFWPALLLARSERLPWALRGVEERHNFSPIKDHANLAGATKRRKTLSFQPFPGDFPRFSGSKLNPTGSIYKCSKSQNGAFFSSRLGPDHSDSECKGVGQAKTGLTASNDQC